MPSKFFAFLILIIISATLLLIALSPVIYIFIMNINLELGGILLLFFNVLEFPVTWILSAVIYKTISWKFNFPKIHFLLILLITGVISSFTFLWVPTFLFVHNYKTSQDNKNFKVNFFLEKEDLVEVNNYTGDKEYPGANPNKYEYTYQIKIDNETNTIYDKTKISINLNDKRKELLLSPIYPTKYITINPGINLLSGSYPIRLMSDAKNFSKEISIALIIEKNNIYKIVYLKSNLQNWDKVIEEQKLFWKKYSTSLLNKK